MFVMVATMRYVTHLVLAVLLLGMVGPRLIYQGRANFAHLTLAIQLLPILQQGNSMPHWALRYVPSTKATADLETCDIQVFRPSWVCAATQIDTNITVKMGVMNAKTNDNLNEIALYYLGSVLFRKGDIMAAADVWRNVPGLSIYLAQQGLAAYSDNAIETALRLWDVAERIDSVPHIYKYRMYTTLCEISRAKGDHTTAIKWCNLAEQSSLSSWPAMVAVAGQWLALDETDRAEHIAQIILNDPTSSRSAVANARRIIGRVMISRKLYSQALQEYQWLESQGQLDKFGWYELGELYIYLDDISAARQALGRAAELDNGTLAQRARTLLEQIK